MQEAPKPLWFGASYIYTSTVMKKAAISKEGGFFHANLGSYFAWKVPLLPPHL